MTTDLATQTDTLDQRAEAATIAAVTAAINCGFNPGGERKVTIKQVVDACAIIVVFLQEAEKGPERTISEWRSAVENLHVSFGSRA